MQLYSYFRSSSAYRVRLVLAHKEIKFESIEVHLIKNGGEQLGAEHSARNPMQQIPTLVSGDLVLNQSMAIALWLEETYPQYKLLSSDSGTKYKQIEFCEIINSGIQPLQNLSVLNRLQQSYEFTDEMRLKWTQDSIFKGLTAIELFLQKTAGEFCFGNHFSLPDCFLIPQLFNAHRFAVNLNQFPLCAQIESTVLKIEKLKPAHPDQQISTPN